MSFDDETIQRVWEKGHTIPLYDQNVYRKDDCEAWIRRGNYGNHNSTFGWEIDHIKPESEGGTDDISNLRPLQWENNRATSAGRLKCVVTSSGNQNVRIK